MPEPRSAPLTAIALKCLAVTLFVAMASCIKATSAVVPPGEAVFFRSFFAFPVIAAWLWWTHDLAHGLETKNPLGHLWRGLVGATAMGCGFTALGMLPFPEVTAIGFTAPVLLVIFAAMFLGEPVGLCRAGPSFCAQDGAPRTDRRHRVLLLAHHNASVAVDHSAGWLGLAVALGHRAFGDLGPLWRGGANSDHLQSPAGGSLGDCAI